jgi:hypothetical protein
MKFKKVFSWLPDAMPETTEAVVLVSACGVVKVSQHKRWCKKNNSYSTVRERVCKKFTNRGKQRHEQESWKGKYQYIEANGKSHAVHRLVALAWIPNPEGKKQVNHKNGVRDDNNVPNLEWCTNKENAIHAREFRDYVKGSSIGTSKLSESDVAEIRKRISTAKRGDLKKIADDYSVSPSTISWIKSGGTWKHA